MDKEPLRILGVRTIFESKKFRIVEQNIEFPDGHYETWEHAELKGLGGVRILAVNENNELLLVREFRGAAGKSILRLPTGAIKEGESIEKAALRELEEEAGFLAQKIQFIETQETTSSYYKPGPLHSFLAKNLIPTQQKRDPGEQTMELLFVPLERAYQMAADIEIKDPQTIYGVFLLKKYLQVQSSPFRA